MSTYDKIAWLPLCGGLTALGLVLSFLAMRRRGVAAGLRGAAWSLLPLAAYLTGAIEMFWKMGIAIGDFATGFVFSVRVWSGLVVTGAAALLFVVSGWLRRRRRATGAEGKRAAGPAATQPAPGRQLAARPDSPAAATAPATSAPATSAPATSAPAKARRSRGAIDDDDDLGDVADILRRHGIT